MNSRIANPYEMMGHAAAANSADSHGTGIVGRLVSWFSRERQYRATYNELSALTDRDLADIGVSRSDIVSIARRCVTNC